MSAKETKIYKCRNNPCVKTFSTSSNRAKHENKRCKHPKQVRKPVKRIKLSTIESDEGKILYKCNTCDYVSPYSKNVTRHIKSNACTSKRKDDELHIHVFNVIRHLAGLTILKGISTLSIPLV